MRRIRAVVIGAMIAVAGCRPPAAPAPARVATTAPGTSGAGATSSLRAFVDGLVDAPKFSNAHWGILIVDPQAGDTLYARNAGKLFMPASNMKLLTSSTALAQLGPAFRYRTAFAARGTVTDGTLHGDLLVVGRGDPSISDRMFGDAMMPLRGIADSLAARGIRRITGRVLAAGNAFPDEVFGYGWTYDDFESSYSAPVDELLFNEGVSELHVRGGGQPGDRVQIETRPARSFPHVHVLATTGSERLNGAGQRWPAGLTARNDSTTWDVILEGEIAPHDSETIDVTQHDPDEAYAAAVREALRDRGIAVDDAAADTTARVDTLAWLSSPPLIDILGAMLKSSQNQIAEMVFRTIALERYGTGRTDSAAVAIRGQLAAWGVGPNETVVRDGSGLSRYDYVSPRAIVHVLDAMRKAPTFAAYYAALPIAGADGTLRHRMTGTAAAHNVHAKTGSLAQARSLSGYVTTSDGRMLIFSILANNWTVPPAVVEHVQDAIAERLAAMELH